MDHVEQSKLTITPGSPLTPLINTIAQFYVPITFDDSE